LFLIIAVQAFATQENQRVKGVLIDMSVRKRFFSVLHDRTKITFIVDKNTVFIQENNRSNFSDTVVGDTVEVIYRMKWRKKIAQVVRVEPSKWRKKRHKGMYDY